MEQVTIAPTVLSATGLVTACITVCKCLNDKEGLSNNIQREALLETSHTHCKFLSLQAELTFVISLYKNTKKLLLTITAKITMKQRVLSKNPQQNQLQQCYILCMCREKMN